MATTTFVVATTTLEQVTGLKGVVGRFTLNL